MTEEEQATQPAVADSDSGSAKAGVPNLSGMYSHLRSEKFEDFLAENGMHQKPICIL